MTATARLITGNRLHLQHGPIDLIIGADGVAAAIERAYRAAWAAFPSILPALVAQLPLLRTPVQADAPEPSSAIPPTLSLPLKGGGKEVGVGDDWRQTSSTKLPAQIPHLVFPPSPFEEDGRGGNYSTAGSLHPRLQEPSLGFPPSPLEGKGRGGGNAARRMIAAVWPYRDQFITPMAAVAGSVADEMLAIMCRAAQLDRAYVNNGGDIAIHLTPEATFTAGVVGDLSYPAVDALIAVSASDNVGGIATSGWRGRSQSLGIADAVTVLARTAADADAAATMIANAVNVEDPAIRRLPAQAVKDDSDLGDLLVTVNVGQLTDGQRRRAISNGAARAREILSKNLIVAAYIQLQGEMLVVGGQSLIARAA